MVKQRHLSQSWEIELWQIQSVHHTVDFVIRVLYQRLCGCIVFSGNTRRQVRKLRSFELEKIAEFWLNVNTGTLLANVGEAVFTWP